MKRKGTSPAETGRSVVIATTAIGEATGSLGAAAALSCVAVDGDFASLLIDVGGRRPRPTLLSSARASRLEERLAAHLPHERVAARGRVCHLAVEPDEAGLEVAARAVALADGCPSIIHLPPALAGLALLESHGVRISGVLMRADPPLAPSQMPVVARDLFVRDLRVEVLARRLGWVAERRALFGALSAETDDGLPNALVRRLLGRLPAPGVMFCPTSNGAESPVADG